MMPGLFFATTIVVSIHFDLCFWNIVVRFVASHWNPTRGWTRRDSCCCCCCCCCSCCSCCCCCSPKVLRPYFVSPCQKWHKKRSSPRNYSNAEVLRPRVYSNVVGFHGRGFIACHGFYARGFMAMFTHDSLTIYSWLLTIYSRLLTILEPLCEPVRSFSYLLGA